MTASRKPPSGGLDMAAQAVAALEAALADKPLTLMIVAELADGVRVFSVPHSPALCRGLHAMAADVIWPEPEEESEE